MGVNKEVNDVKKNLRTLLLIIFMLLTFVLGGFIVYDKFIAKNNECETLSGNYDNCLTENLINDNKINYKKILNNYKNYDGTYGSYKTLVINDIDGKRYYARLMIDGTINFREYGKNDINITNISNAVDIAYNELGMGDNKFYILLDNGDVYKYEFSDYANKNYVASKLNEVKDIIKFVDITYCMIKNAGCNNSFGVIDKNNLYIDNLEWIKSCK